MRGHIAGIDILYTVHTPDGPKHTRHHLYNMRQHIQPDRVEELITSLTSICEDLLAARAPARPGQPQSLPRRRPAP